MRKQNGALTEWLGSGLQNRNLLGTSKKRHINSVP